jgi:hypothetical protein
VAGAATQSEYLNIGRAYGGTERGEDLATLSIHIGSEHARHRQNACTVEAAGDGLRHLAGTDEA